MMSAVNGVRVFQLDIGPTPTVDRIAAACEALDAFQRAHPRRQADAPAH